MDDLKIGDIVQNNFTSKDNPCHYGIILKKFTTTGFVNPGKKVEVLLPFYENKIRTYFYEGNNNQKTFTVTGHLDFQEIIKILLKKKGIKKDE